MGKDLPWYCESWLDHDGFTLLICWDTSSKYAEAQCSL